VELFAGRSQLLVYHFMFGPEYTAGCPICSAAADTFDGSVASTGTDPAGYMSEAHGLSAFARADAVGYHTYSCYARGPEFLLGFYPLLDRAPLGRNEGRGVRGVPARTRAQPRYVVLAPRRVRRRRWGRAARTGDRGA
jgi:predicted dithiol-disulfide oxidoreductase (DUF899 family)